MVTGFDSCFLSNLPLGCSDRKLPLLYCLSRIDTNVHIEEEMR